MSKNKGAYGMRLEIKNKHLVEAFRDSEAPLAITSNPDDNDEFHLLLNVEDSVYTIQVDREFLVVLREIVGNLLEK
jgi:hypothetical protein